LNESNSFIAALNSDSISFLDASAASSCERNEAEAKKAETVEAIISREVLFGTIEETKKDARVEELSAWDESRLTGFSDALAAMPEPAQEIERSFGKGKSADEGEVPETKREFGMKVVKGNIKLDPEYYRGK
jgi:hypothetical protein